MTETASPEPASGVDGEPNQSGIRVLAQFIKDLSFESPHAPESLRPNPVSPQIDLGVELNVRGREDGLFEVELKLNAKAMRETETVFNVELVYAGLFQAMGVPQSDLEAVLMIECPRFLFPFARRIIADLSVDGGFPPFMLEPLDFAGIYAARKQQSAGSVVGNA
ncbi:MAG: protein-export chaperone SecB [Caulobacteraceae bacterium]